MRTISISSTILFMAIATASAQEVRCEKYQLPNGMNVILHEDHSLPVATVNIWYYVGSKDESPGRSGFAHLFEHLMFMGTHRVPGSDFDNLMEGGGGFNNASTTQDRTNYYSFGPSALLPTLLWLDADRLEDLGKEMNKEKLDKQREVVRNERRQSSEMQPYGKAELKITELMFPPGHPYHIEVIGTHEDLQAATVQDVKNFFANFYLPNNASLVVAGDFDPKAIKPLIAKLFGSLPRGPQPVHRQAEPAKFEGVRRVTYTDQVQFARTSFVYHSPAHFQPGDAEMELAAAILTDGKSSRLYKRLVYDDKIATSVSANQNSMLLGSLFSVEITAKDGVSLDKIENVADEVIAEFCKKGPTSAELERQKAGIEYHHISGLQSLMRKADKLNEYQFAFGEPNSFKRDLDRYRKAGTSDVRKWSSKVLTPGARLVMRVLPEDKNSVGPREKQPEPMAEAKFAPTAPTVFKLSNGIEVRHWRRSDLPLLSVGLLLPGGSCTEEPDKAGLAYMTASMLDEGAGSRGAIAFSDALDQIGATFGASCSEEATHITLNVLKRNADKAMDLYADAILRPRFEQKEWDRVKTLHLEGLRQEEDHPTAVATRVGLRNFFGDAHPYGRPVEGTTQTITGLSVDAVKSCHNRCITPAGAIFFIGGDLSADEAKAMLEKRFGGWKAPPDAAVAKAHEPLAAPQNHSARVVIVDKPGAVQTVIRFYMPGPSYANANRLPLELVNTILGGSFTSRLNQNLREKHGYTYGARSHFEMDSRIGYFQAGADVQSEHTGEALKEFFSEFQRMAKGGISPTDGSKARQTRRVELVHSFEGLRGLIGTAMMLQEKGAPFTALGDDLNAVGSINEKTLDSAAAGAIPLDQSLLVLVGDAKLIREQIKELPLPAPVQLSVQGDPLASAAK